MLAEITERDEFILVMYHCDHMRFAAFCDDCDCDRIDFLNDNLSNGEISRAIESYNQKTFGVTFGECKKRMCLFCKDFSKCNLLEREKYEQAQTKKEMGV